MIRSGFPSRQGGWPKIGFSRREAPHAAVMPCPVCDEVAAWVVGTRDRRGLPLKMVACTGCGLMRVDPLPSLDELKEFHESEYRHDYKGVRSPKRKHTYRAGQLAAERLHRLKGHLAADAAVLDVGCSSGEWLYLLSVSGRVPLGIEVDTSYAAFGRQEYGVEIRTGTMWEQDLPDRVFDMITSFHVLEHLPNPVQSLQRIRRWAKDGGLLAIEVPNVNSRYQHPAKRFHYAHPIGFTPESLRLALYLSGWNVVELSLDRHDRNIFVIARNETVTVSEAGSHRFIPRPPVSQPLVSSALETLGYYLQVSTYSRWLSRLKGFAMEFYAIRDGRRQREILDAIAGIRGLCEAPGPTRLADANRDSRIS